MSLPEEALSFTEPITEPDILADIETLPTEDDLPCDDGEPLETARHRDQMELLIRSLQAHWSERHNYYVGGNMFLHYDPRSRRKFRGPDFFLVMNVDTESERAGSYGKKGCAFLMSLLNCSPIRPRRLIRERRKRSMSRCSALPNTICMILSCRSSRGIIYTAHITRKHSEMHRDRSILQ